SAGCARLGPGGLGLGPPVRAVGRRLGAVRLAVARVREREAAEGPGQRGRERGEVVDRASRLEHAPLGLRREIGDRLHRLRDVVGAPDLLARGERDVAGEAGRRPGDAADLPEAVAGTDGDRVAALDLARTFLRRDDRFLRLGLHVLDEGGDLPGRARRALGELADLVGDDAEAEPGLAGAGGL